MSPHTVTGACTGCTLLSSTSRSFTCHPERTASASAPARGHARLARRARLDLTHTLHQAAPNPRNSPPVRPNDLAPATILQRGGQGSLRYHPSVGAGARARAHARSRALRAGRGAPSHAARASRARSHARACPRNGHRRAAGAPSPAGYSTRAPPRPAPPARRVLRASARRRCRDTSPFGRAA